jgi:hypothetical protein
MDLITKRIRIMGSQQNGPKYLYEALDSVAQGTVKTIVEAYPLAEAPKAYDRVAQGEARLRAVLTMQPADPGDRPLFRTDLGLATPGWEDSSRTQTLRDQRRIRYQNRLDPPGEFHGVEKCNK